MRAIPTTNEKPSRTGLTLVEVVVSTLLVSLLMIAALRTVSAVTLSHRLAGDIDHGPRLAHTMIAEITQRGYKQEGTSTIGRDGENQFFRNTWDDVDDYDGTNNSPPKIESGGVMNDLSGWRRQVSVDWVTPANPSITSGSDTGLKRITVTVTSPAGETYILEALRSETGAFEAPLPSDTTIQTGQHFEIETTDGTIHYGQQMLPNGINN